jgi:DNA invertase Pin-like site-specific DNA recombinase
VAYDGYIRVSRVGGREGDSFQSPAEQRRQIEGWAKLRKVKIAQWHEDLDQSGGRLDRPGLEAVQARIKSKKTEGVAVAKLDRLSRLGVADALKLVEGIHADGGSIAAVDLGIDPATPFGEFGMTLMLALARMERRRLTDSWSSAKENAVSRGVFVGPTPLGFVKTKNNGGHLVPNSDAPKVAELFSLSASDGIHAALHYCEATWPDRAWSTFKVRRLLTNRIYKGDIVVGDLVGHIEPLVDEFTWDLAQHPVRENERRKPKDAYPLSGIATCAGCGKTLVGHTTGKAGKRHRAYRCTTHGCPLHIKAEPLEQLVLDAVRSVPRPKQRSGEDAFQSAKAIVTARAELERFVADTEAHEIMGDELWRQGLRDRQAAYEAAQMARDEAREAVELPDLEDPTPEDMRTIFERAVSSLTVRRSRDPLPERVALTLAA